MSYKYNDDDVIVFDLFDDEQYMNWQKEVSKNAGAERKNLNEGSDSAENKSPEIDSLLTEPGEAEYSEKGATDEEIDIRPVFDDKLFEIEPDADDIQDDFTDIGYRDELKKGITEIGNVEEDTKNSSDEAVSTKTTSISPAEQRDNAKRSKEDDKSVNSPRNAMKAVIEILSYIAVALLIITIVPRYVMERVSVDGDSMNRTLYDGDQLIGDKLTVRMNRLKRFDIIYFNPQGNKQVEPYIKRIIGLPGDTVKIADSVIYINGMPLQEDYAAEDHFKAYSASETIWLGEDEYFVLGDNRNNSTDSRSSSVGVVRRSDIEGRAVFRIWPLASFGKID